VQLSEVIGNLTLGETLQVLCSRARISRKELAQLVGVSTGALSNYLGDVTLPSAARLRKMTDVLAAALDADRHELWVALGHALEGSTLASDVSVLLVDDNERLRASLGGLLDDLGFRVVGRVSNGTEALELVGRLPVDVVLMDLKMPAMDGIEAARGIKEIRPSTQVVALSAHDDTGFRLAVEDAGMDGYLLKGTPPHLIRETLLRTRRSKTSSTVSPGSSELLR
jgi:CheY-like chemotaxis protein